MSLKFLHEKKEENSQRDFETGRTTSGSKKESTSDEIVKKSLMSDGEGSAAASSQKEDEDKGMSFSVNLELVTDKKMTKLGSWHQILKERQTEFERAEKKNLFSGRNSHNIEETKNSSTLANTTTVVDKSLGNVVTMTTNTKLIDNVAESGFENVSVAIEDEDISCSNYLLQDLAKKNDDDVMTSSVEENTIVLNSGIYHETFAFNFDVLTKEELNEGCFESNENEFYQKSKEMSQMMNKTDVMRTSNDTNLTDVDLDIKNNSNESNSNDCSVKCIELSCKKTDKLILEGLTPKMSTNSNLRKSYHSKRKHSNSITKQQFGQFERHREEKIGDVLRKREDELKSCEDVEEKILFITRGTRTGEKDEELGRHSSYLEAAKALIGDAKVHRSTSYRLATTTKGQDKTTSKSLADDLLRLPSKMSTSSSYVEPDCGDESILRTLADLTSLEAPVFSDDPLTSHDHMIDSYHSENVMTTTNCSSVLSEEQMMKKQEKNGTRRKNNQRNSHRRHHHRHHHRHHTTDSITTTNDNDPTTLSRHLSQTNDSFFLSPSVANVLGLQQQQQQQHELLSDNETTGMMSNTTMEMILTSPTKSSGMKRRLKEIFMDKSSPSTNDKFIYDDDPPPPATSSSSLYTVVAPPSSSSTTFTTTTSEKIIMEGQLNCKNTMINGKRSTDRAWKCTYTLLRNHHLYLHPDKMTQNVSVYDHSVSVKSALVDIAYDYVKRKNVFRLTTFNISEFLMEATDQESMLKWIKLIQESGFSASGDKMFSSSRELIRRQNLLSHQALFLHGSSSLRKSQRSSRTSSKISESSKTRKSSSDFLRSPKRDLNKTNEEEENEEHSTVVRNTTDVLESKSKDGKTWKSKMVKRLKRLSATSPSNVEQIHVFGCELNKCLPSSTNEFVPSIVDVCINIIESKGLTNKGIYRVPGNSAAISQLQAELNKDPMTINTESEKWQDVNAVISLLKLFFRELAEPLITKELYSSMIEANRFEDRTKRMLKMKKTLHSLPIHNFETFHFLARHLKKVSAAGDVNKMDARNLAIVFGPTLMQPKQDMLNMVKDMSDQCRVVESIIQHCDWFFSSWDEDVNVPADGINDGLTVPITGMNQQLIEKVEHMKFHEEHSLSNKKTWKSSSNVGWKTSLNTKEHCSAVVLMSGSHESAINSGEQNADNNESTPINDRQNESMNKKTEKRKGKRDEGGGVKMRAKSVPPRPVSSFTMEAGKPVERMIETAPAKRKNSSPVSSIHRKSSASGEGDGKGRSGGGRKGEKEKEDEGRGRRNLRQNYNCSNSEMSDRGEDRQNAVASNSNPNSSVSGSNRQNRSHTLQSNVRNLKTTSTETLTLTNRGPEHSNNSQGTDALRESKRQKGRREIGGGGFGKISHAKSVTVSNQSESRTGSTDRKAGTTHRKPDGEKNRTIRKRDDVKTGRDNETLKRNDKKDFSLEREKRKEMEEEEEEIDGKTKKNISGKRIEEEKLVLRPAAESRKVWNAVENKWEEIAAKKNVNMLQPGSSITLPSWSSSAFGHKKTHEKTSHEKSHDISSSTDAAVIIRCSRDKIHVDLNEENDMKTTCSISTENVNAQKKDKENDHQQHVRTVKNPSSAIKESHVHLKLNSEEKKKKTFESSDSSLLESLSFGDVFVSSELINFSKSSRHDDEESRKNEMASLKRREKEMKASCNISSPSNRRRHDNHCHDDMKHSRRHTIDGSHDENIEFLNVISDDDVLQHKELERAVSEPTLRMASPSSAPGNEKKEEEGNLTKYDKSLKIKGRRSKSTSEITKEYRFNRQRSSNHFLKSVETSHGGGFYETKKKKNLKDIHAVTYESSV